MDDNTAMVVITVVGLIATAAIVWIKERDQHDE